jgi:preprotein translocase subunit SecG
MTSSASLEKQFELSEGIIRMFTTLILILHIIVCIALILIILLQTGKGADIGAVFGGGSSQTLFGSTGATPFLSKVTIGAAVIFMITSIILTYFSGKGIQVEKSIVTGAPGTEGPMIPTGVPPSQPTTGGGQPGTDMPKPEGTAPESPPSGPAATQSQPAAPPAQPVSPAPAQPAPASPGSGDKAPETK